MDKNLFDKFSKTEKFPVLFVGHGNPMNALYDNEITRGWADMVNGIEKPQAILCISAHWETDGTYVTLDEKPKTIHDFYGFPKKLFDIEYPAPGSSEYAELVINSATDNLIKPSKEWGLDHGTWSVLVKMFPKADIPVIQLSLDRRKHPVYHYELAKELSKLRNSGVLIIGSGNIIHNLRLANFNAEQPYEWAVDFDDTVRKLILNHDHKQLIDYEKLGRSALLSIPTPEHYLPMLYTLALQEENEEITFFNEMIDFGSGGMRSFIIK